MGFSPRRDKSATTGQNFLSFYITSTLPEHLTVILRRQPGVLMVKLVLSTLSTTPLHSTGRAHSGQVGERGRCGVTQEALPAHLTCSESPSFMLLCSATSRHRSPASELRTSLMPCWLGSPWVSPGQQPWTSEALWGVGGKGKYRGYSERLRTKGKQRRDFPNVVNPKQDTPTHCPMQ